MLMICKSKRESRGRRYNYFLREWGGEDIAVPRLRGIGGSRIGWKLDGLREKN
jgi:hypothetical protein